MKTFKQHLNEAYTKGKERNKLIIYANSQVKKIIKKEKNNIQKWINFWQKEYHFTVFDPKIGEKVSIQFTKEENSVQGEFYKPNIIIIYFNDKTLKTYKGPSGSSDWMKLQFDLVHEYIHFLEYNKSKIYKIILSSINRKVQSLLNRIGLPSISHFLYSRSSEEENPLIGNFISDASQFKKMGYSKKDMIENAKHWIELNKYPNSLYKKVKKIIEDEYDNL